MIERLSEARNAAFARSELFHFIWKNKLSSVTLHGPKLTEHRNLLHSRIMSISQEWQHVFLKEASYGPQRLLQTRTLLVRAVPPAQLGPSCAWGLSPAIPFWSNCKMINRCSILDSNLNSAAWPMSCRGFICSKIPVWSLNSLDLFKTPKLRPTVSGFQLL